MTVVDVVDSPALSLLLRLENEGFQFELVDPDGLRVRPVDRVTPELLAELQLHKPDLLLLIRICDAGVQDRRELFRAQRDAAADRIPAFLFRAGVPYVSGWCYSCGDPLNADRFGACWRCALARRLACGAAVPPDLLAALDLARMEA